MAESMKGPIHYVRGRTWPRRWSLVDQNPKKYYRQFLKIRTSTSAKKCYNYKINIDLSI